MLQQLLDIEHAVIQAPMAGVQNSALAIAVAKAGLITPRNTKTHPAFAVLCACVCYVLDSTVYSYNIFVRTERRASYGIS